MGKRLFETSAGFRDNILSYPTFLTLSIQLQMTTRILYPRTWLIFNQPEYLLNVGLRNSGNPGVYSLGEYAALCVSGALSVTEAPYLVCKRSSMTMENCTPGSSRMLAVAAPVKTIEEALANQDLASYEISCTNAPEISVVSKAHELLKQKTSSVFVIKRLHWCNIKDYIKSFMFISKVRTSKAYKLR